MKFVKGQVFRHVNPTKSKLFTFRNYFLTHRSIVNTVCFSYLILGSWVARKSAELSRTTSSAVSSKLCQRQQRLRYCRLQGGDRCHVTFITGFRKNSPPYLPREYNRYIYIEIVNRHILSPHYRHIIATLTPKE